MILETSGGNGLAKDLSVTKLCRGNRSKVGIAANKDDKKMTGNIIQTLPEGSVSVFPGMRWG